MAKIHDIVLIDKNMLLDCPCAGVHDSLKVACCGNPERANQRQGKGSAGV